MSNTRWYPWALEQPRDAGKEQRDGEQQQAPERRSVKFDLCVACLDGECMTHLGTPVGRLMPGPGFGERIPMGFDLGAGDDRTVVLCMCGHESDSLEAALEHVRRHGWRAIHIDGIR